MTKINIGMRSLVETRKVFIDNSTFGNAPGEHSNWLRNEKLKWMPILTNWSFSWSWSGTWDWKCHYSKILRITFIENYSFPFVQSGLILMSITLGGTMAALGISQGISYAIAHHRNHHHWPGYLWPLSCRCRWSPCSRRWRCPRSSSWSWWSRKCPHLGSFSNWSQRCKTMSGRKKKKD